MTIENALKLNKLIDLFETIEDPMYNDLTVAQVRIFLEVASEDGILMQGLIKKTGKPQGSISRNVRKMSVRISKDNDGNFIDTGIGILETRHDQYAVRNFSVHLTAKGKKFLDVLIKSLETD
jgi:DNA-binding MarR family transcriptional regulator